ncbi:unnamed protein product [Trichogramma brassicae]|uniref:Uncharacterized protein n=1 Tax=Trichogramma brassicae TaxID=86971 RepID=A0A6H5IN20_9HYME|nr:unnamed protein product [Trichogramma brassicae]
MENYADCMNRLMKESRENRALRREVNTLDFQAVKDKLLARYCSVFGAEPLLRERLLRARLREIPSLADRVPWFEFDNYDPDAELNYIPTENVNHSRRSHNESEKRTQLQPSSSDDDANQPTRIVVEAEIHKPPNKIEPFANMSRRSGVTVQPSQPPLEPLELIHSLPLQLPIDKEKSADARNQSLVEKKQELKSWRSWRQPSTRSFDLMKKLERPCGRKYGNNSRTRISTNLTHLHTMPVEPSREIILRPWRSNAIDKLAQRDEPLATTFARASITESSTNPTIVEPVRTLANCA